MLRKSLSAVREKGRADPPGGGRGISEGGEWRGTWDKKDAPEGVLAILLRGGGSFRGFRTWCIEVTKPARWCRQGRYVVLR